MTHDQEAVVALTAEANRLVAEVKRLRAVNERKVEALKFARGYIARYCTKTEGAPGRAVAAIDRVLFDVDPVKVLSDMAEFCEKCWYLERASIDMPPCSLCHRVEGGNPTKWKASLADAKEAGK